MDDAILDDNHDKDDLVDLARIILETNYFEFNGDSYSQRMGTAIVTKFPPAYANIFLARLEEKILSEVILKPWVWWRFLDDVWFIW